MILLMPGRHLALTRYQFAYLKPIVERGLVGCLGWDGNDLGLRERVSGIVFAVTSANHHDTRRNPVPYALRVLALHDFAQELGVPAWIYGIDDVGEIPDFPQYLLRRIAHLSEGRFRLDPANAVVAVSTPIGKTWADLGFKVLPVERAADGTMRGTLPGDLVALAGRSRAWRDEPVLQRELHPVTLSVWDNYRVGETIGRLWKDPILGDDGDLTGTRDYGSYVRSMDENAESKFRETAPFVKSGRIGDIGCAVGSWIRQAAGDARLRESEFYGVEVVRPLFDICQQRKERGDFGTPWVFFAMKNAVGAPVFEPASMDTIHTSALTHEICSYGSEGDLKAFVKNRFAELKPGGVWINRDVLGPEDGARPVILALANDDGNDAVAEPKPKDRKALEAYLASRSTRVRFVHFTADFRPGKGEPFPLTPAGSHGRWAHFRTTLSQACEFLYKKDYPDNWESEMHERFCFWSWSDWQREITGAGFRLAAGSRPWRNEWIVENRFRGHAALFEEKDGALAPLDFPHSHMTLVAERVQ